MNASLSRRRFVRIAGGLSFTAIAMMAGRSAGWAQTATPSAAPPAAGTPVGGDPLRRLLLRIELSGGFVPVEVDVTRLPLVSVYADGSVVTEGPMIEIYPQPILPNLRVTKLTAEGLAAVLATAEDALVPLGGQHLDGALVTDVPDTVFTLIRADGSITTVSAYALGFDEASVTDSGLRANRDALIRLRDLLVDLPSALPADQIAAADAAYVIDRLRVYARAIPAGTPVGDAELPQPPVNWPLADDLGAFGQPASPPLKESGTRCGVVAGADAAILVETLKSANQLTPWISGGRQYVVWIRPLLPDEASDCSTG